MTFKQGQSGNPKGRPIGMPGLRKRAIRLVNEWSRSSSDPLALERKLEAEFRKDPLEFFRKFIMPVAPAKALAIVRSAIDKGLAKAIGEKEVRQ